MTAVIGNGFCASDSHLSYYSKSYPVVRSLIVTGIQCNGTVTKSLKKAIVEKCHLSFWQVTV